jgi:excisionase family DNA binding protein
MHARRGAGFTAGISSAAHAAFLTEEEYAARLNVSRRHLRRLVDAGKAVQPYRLGRCLRFPLKGAAGIEQWEADGCPPVRTVKGGAA